MYFVVGYEAHNTDRHEILEDQTCVWYGDWYGTIPYHTLPYRSTRMARPRNKEETPSC